jgi:hypothetical protein
MSSAMPDEVPPILSLELERRIFETAALSRPVSIPAMMRVARRVNHWCGEIFCRHRGIVLPAPTGLNRCYIERSYLSTLSAYSMDFLL